MEKPAPPTTQPRKTWAHPHRCPTGAHPEPHRSCYTRHRCRCGRCRELNRLASASYVDFHRRREGRDLAGFTDAEATSTRLRTLKVKFGLKQSELGDLVGLTQSSVSLLFAGQPRVRRSTAERVRRVYERALKHASRRA